MSPCMINGISRPDWHHYQQVTWSPPRGFVSVEKIKYRVGARDTSSESIFGDFDAVTLTEKGQCIARLKDLNPGSSYAIQV
jgi:hypothetical protein